MSLFLIWTLSITVLIPLCVLCHIIIFPIWFIATTIATTVSITTYRESFRYFLKDFVVELKGCLPK